MNLFYNMNCYDHRTMVIQRNLISEFEKFIIQNILSGAACSSSVLKIWK